MTERVRLEAFSDAHVDGILNACGDWVELAQWGLPYWRPRSAAEIQRKIASQAGPQLAPEYNFVIRADHDMVGECSVHSIDHRNRVGQLGVCVWDPAKRHRGYGRETVSQLIDWATGYLGLLRLEAWVVEGNSASERLFDDLGFKSEGFLTNRLLIQGRRVGQHVYARCW